MTKKQSSLIILSIIIISFAVYGVTHSVGQKNKAFTIKSLTIKKGETVKFPNLDPFFHNVYSLSPAKIFDLGSYPKGQSKSVKFNKKGHVEVRCAIHPQMKMDINVK